MIAAKKVNMEPKKFSWKERGNSFSYAWSGIKALFRTEHNSWIHFGLTIAAIIAAFIFHISKVEFIILILSMCLVWITEIINTAIEKIMDFISIERKPQINQIKDLVAAAVLITAIAAFIIGCIIFVPKILYYE